MFSSDGMGYQFGWKVGRSDVELRNSFRYLTGTV